MRFSLRTFLIASMLAVLTLALALKSLDSRVGEERVAKLGLGSMEFTVDRLTLRAGDRTVLCNDRAVCIYLTQQMRGSTVSTTAFFDVGEDGVVCDVVSVELAEGGRSQGAAIIGRKGLLMSLSPNNKSGWDYRFNYFVPFNDPVPDRLQEIVTFLSSDTAKHLLRLSVIPESPVAASNQAP